MPFWSPLDRPTALWLQRVLIELSDLHDAGAIDEDYLRRAWLTLHLVAVGGDPDLSREPWRQEVLDWLVRRSGLTAEEVGGITVDDVFGGIPPGDSLPGSGRQSRDDERALEFIPGYAIGGRRWKFSTQDSDSNRPAPHGHDKEDRRIVLDPYKGVITDQNGTTTKVKAKELRELWNDPDFRSTAAKARKWMAENQRWRTDAVPPLPEGVQLPDV